ncbi:MAG TPA: hypothetical protein VHZ51_29440 [Ktedonobacteraceae bacterium]|jgi:hypothetical protein|nr:hypothetical protein [Ktedonobacteraceae bacterium]
MNLQLAEALNAPDAPLFVRVSRIVWEHLPLLLFADLTLCLAALPSAVVWLGGFTLLVPWVAALTLGPVWTGVSAIANSLVSGEEVSWCNLLRAIGHHWRSAIATCAVPALVAALFIGTWQILAAHPHMTWLYLPLFIDGCVGTCVWLACLSAFSVMTTRTLHGWTLWKVSLALTRLRLGRMLGILAVFVVLGLLLFVFNAAGCIPLLFAPLAVCLAAQTQQTCELLLDREAKI